MTYREELHDAAAQIAYASIGGSPWTVEMEKSFAALLTAIDTAIDCDENLRDVFNVRLRHDDGECVALPF